MNWSIVSVSVGLDNYAMTESLIRDYWALFGAAAAVLAAGLMLAVTFLRQSRHGRLAALVREHRLARRSLESARAAYAKVQAKVQRLEKKVERIPPRKMDEAKGALADARRVVEIRGGALQVVENKLRLLIAEEYPPRRHAALRLSLIHI